MHLLSQRIAHLEADLCHLQHRKAELEQENQDLAAAGAARSELEEQLSTARAATARLEAECQQLRAAGHRRAEQDQHEAEMSRSLLQMQGVLSQLLKRLGELEAQRAKLAEQKAAAEATVRRLRQELEGRASHASSCFAWPPVAWPPASPALPPPTPAVCARRPEPADKGLRRPPGALARPPPKGQRPRSASLGHVGCSSPNLPKTRCSGFAPVVRQEPSQGFTEPVVQPGTVPAGDFRALKAECDLLQQRLLYEEQSAREAAREREIYQRAAAAAEAKAQKLQVQLRQLLSSWATEDGDEAMHHRLSVLSESRSQFSSELKSPFPGHYVPHLTLTEPIASPAFQAHHAVLQ